MSSKLKTCDFPVNVMSHFSRNFRSDWCVLKILISTGDFLLILRAADGGWAASCLPQKPLKFFEIWTRGFSRICSMFHNSNTQFTTGSETRVGRSERGIKEWEETNKKTPVLPEWTSKGMFYAEGLPDKSYLVMRFYLLLIDVAYVTRGFQNFQGFNLFSI